MKRRVTLSPDGTVFMGKAVTAITLTFKWVLYVSTFLFIKIKKKNEVNFIRHYRNTKPVKRTPDDLINENIPNVKLLFIDDEGTKVGIISKAEALRYAEEKELDVVVVSPNSKPMVAKLMDYSKYRYEQQKKLREAKKNQKTVELKEIKLSPTIDIGDFNTKLKHANRFIDKGNKVKVSIYFRGRMITHRDVGFQVVQRFIKELGEKIVVEAHPKMEGRNLIAIVAPAESK